jgi:hypothetical protein
MLDDFGIVKLVDNSLINYDSSTYQRMQQCGKFHAPLSPNLLLQLKEKKKNAIYNVSKEESWALGITTLCAATNSNISYFYNWKKTEINWEHLIEKLESVNDFYSKQIYAFLEASLESTEDKRPTIENHSEYLKPYLNEILELKLDFKVAAKSVTELNRNSQAVRYVRDNQALRSDIQGGYDRQVKTVPVVSSQKN